VRRSLGDLSIAALAVVGLLAGIPSAAAAAPGDDPCSLLRAKEIAKVFRAKVGPATPGDLVPDCSWKVGSDDEVTANLDTGDGKAAYDAVIDVGAALGGDNIVDTPVRGLGKEATLRVGDLVTVYVVTDDGGFVSVQADFPALAGESGAPKKRLAARVTRLARLAAARA
jgi:hypothetical protein